MNVTVLAGGVGGATFVRGLLATLGGRENADVTVVANVGDDMWLNGLRVAPDLDSLMYALAGVNDRERGWGRAGDSSRVSEELAAFGVGWPWFALQDLDLGTHIARTSLLREGLPLSAVTQHLAARWSLPVTLLPASDHEVETWVELPASSGEPPLMHFEEWWVRLRASIDPVRFIQRGLSDATPAPGVTAAIESADVVFLAPSNPVVSIGTMTGIPGGAGRSGLTGIPGIAEAIRTTTAPVVGVSPVIGRSVVRGMGDVCLRAIGQPVSALGVGTAYGSRSATSGQGLLDGWLVDLSDADAIAPLSEVGVMSEAVPIWMTDDDLAAELAATALRFAERLHP